MLCLSPDYKLIRQVFEELNLSPAEAARRIGITDVGLVEAFFAGAPLEGVTVMLGRSESEFNINVDLQGDRESAVHDSEEHSWMAIDDGLSCMAQHMAGSF